MRALAVFLAARLVRALIAVWLVSTVVFVVMRLSGDPVPLLLPPDAPRSEYARVARELGTDRPLPVQYAVFLGHVVRGDFGRSIHFREPAMRVALGYLPATIQLGLTAFTLAVLVAVPVGVVSAVRRNTAVDHAAMAVALVGQSVPNFWLAIMMILLFAVSWGLLPTSGRGGVAHVVMPAVAIAINLMALLTRLVRSTMIEMLAEDYVRTARAKGLREVAVLARHALPNVLIPLVTVVGLQFGYILGGAVVIETIFTWPGVGLFTIQAILNRDYPVVQASVFVLATAVVLHSFPTRRSSDHRKSVV